MPSAARTHQPPGPRPERPTACQRGYGRKWREVSAAFLRAHPLCEYCQAEGIIRPATCVDHRKAHKGDMKLFWDRRNWAPCCNSHNSRKAVREEGGFGRSPT